MRQYTSGNDTEQTYCCTFLVQPNDVNNEANDYKHKNSNYGSQGDVIARAFAFLSS